MMVTYILLGALFLGDQYSAIALEASASSSFRRKLLNEKEVGKKASQSLPADYDVSCKTIDYCNNCTDPYFGFGNYFEREESKQLPWLGLVVNTVARKNDVDYLTMTLESIASALSPDPVDPLGPEDVRVRVGGWHNTSFAWLISFACCTGLRPEQKPKEAPRI
jgi:hypothetical protein